jgi:ketosteroid isomerase-like protein
VAYRDGGSGKTTSMVDRKAVSDWVAEYERAWRSPGTADLTGLFTDAVVYVMSPWAAPIEGLEALRRFWEASRSPDEAFEMRSEIVAIDGQRAIVRVSVDYDDGQRWRDLWVLDLNSEGRCHHFEEWPFAPNQSDGHEGDR